MRRIDIEAAAKIHTVLSLCRSKGLDPVRALDQARLLRHLGTRCEDAVMTVDVAIEGIRGLPADPSIKTPLDMKNMIIGFLERYRDGISAEV
jgi:hypothetical protein